MYYPFIFNLMHSNDQSAMSSPQHCTTLHSHTQSQYHISGCVTLPCFALSCDTLSLESSTGGNKAFFQWAAQLMAYIQTFLRQTSAPSAYGNITTIVALVTSLNSPQALKLVWKPHSYPNTMSPWHLSLPFEEGSSWPKDFCRHIDQAQAS